MKPFSHIPNLECKWADDIVSDRDRKIALRDEHIKNLEASIEGKEWTIEKLESLINRQSKEIEKSIEIFKKFTGQR